MLCDLHRRASSATLRIQSLRGCWRVFSMSNNALSPLIWRALTNELLVDFTSMVVCFLRLSDLSR